MTKGTTGEDLSESDEEAQLIGWAEKSVGSVERSGMLVRC